MSAAQSNYGHSRNKKHAVINAAKHSTKQTGRCTADGKTARRLMHIMLHLLVINAAKHSTI
jgi:hypothetical protein